MQSKRLIRNYGNRIDLSTISSKRAGFSQMANSPSTLIYRSLVNRSSSTIFTNRKLRSEPCKDAASSDNVKKLMAILCIPDPERNVEYSRDCLFETRLEKYSKQEFSSWIIILHWAIRSIFQLLRRSRLITDTCQYFSPELDTLEFRKGACSANNLSQKKPKHSFWRCDSVCSCQFIWLFSSDHAGTMPMKFTHLWRLNCVAHTIAIELRRKSCGSCKI